MEKHRIVGLQKKRDTLKCFSSHLRQKRHTSSQTMMVQMYKFNNMTQNIDLNELTTDQEILQQYRDELEHRIKDLFI